MEWIIIMKKCEKIKTCRFIQKHENNEEVKVALRGFIKKYCGSRQKSNKCIRKELANMLNGWDKIPDNMMPNGLRLPGTNDSDWLDKIKKTSKQMLINNCEKREWILK